MKFFLLFSLVLVNSHFSDIFFLIPSLIIFLILFSIAFEYSFQEALRDDIRDIKLNQQRNDRTLQEEANMWRAHTEQLLNGQGNRHLQDVSRLQDMLMKMVVGSSVAPQQQLSGQIAQPHQLPKSTEVMVSSEGYFII